MKLRFLSPAILLLIICLNGCSNSEKTEHVTSSDSEYTEPDKSVEAKEFKFSNQQLTIVNEQLFLFLRNQIPHVDEKTFVEFEELNLNGKKFTYSAVILEAKLIDWFVLMQQEQQPGVFNLKNYLQDFEVIGSYEIDSSNQSISEEPIPELTIKIEAKVHSSRDIGSPYSTSGYEREIDDFDFNKNLVVNINQPKIYLPDELYLKARIQELTKEDLSELSTSDLGYLRNELFARHGHIFKTDKMKSYFKKQDWYHPYHEDATPFLNEIEKKNANFIKSLEG